MSKSSVGSIENPYQQWEYEVLVQQNQWNTAAWVKLNNGTLVQLSPTGQVLQSYGVGEEQNPYTWEEFQRLYPDSWTGGWIIDKNGRKVYYNSEGEEEDVYGSSGSGCGCVLEGSSGSGSGDGDDFPIPDISRVKLLAGSQNCMVNLEYGTLRFNLSWGTGYFSALDAGPSISVSGTDLTPDPGYGGSVSPVRASWENPFRVKITFTYSYSCQRPPMHGGQNLNIFYGIPEEFRQYDEE